MGYLQLQALWVWILLGLAVAVSAWWATIRPGRNSGRLLGPAIAAIIILLFILFFQGAASGQLPLPF